MRTGVLRRAMIGLATMAALGAASAQAATPYRWSPVPFGAGGFVDGFVYHPKAAGLLYARTDIGGLYRYDPNAKAWIPLMDQLGHDDGQLMGVLSVALDPRNPDVVYAACGEYVDQWAHLGAVLRSDDRGAHWRRTDLTIRLGGNADGRGSGERLAVDPNDSQGLLLASSQDGLWRSDDGARSFRHVGEPAAKLSLVIFDPASGGAGRPSRTVYVGADDAQGGLFVSQDGGASFARVAGLPNQAPQHAVFAADGALYVTFASGDGKGTVNPSYATAGSVWRRDVASGRWSDVTPVRTGGFGYSGVDVDRARPGVVVVSTLDRWNGGDDVFLSSDAGAHWQALGAQSRHDATPYPWLVNYTGGEDHMGHWIADVKINPFASDEMIYGTGYGLWMSRNLTAAGGAQPVQFDFRVAGLEETATAQMISPLGGASLLAAFGDVGGAAWDDLSKTPSDGIFAPTNESDTSVDYAGQNPKLVVRTAAKAPTHAYFSRDNGASWQAFPATPYQPQDASGAWHATGTLAISARGASLVWVPEKEPAYYSADGGKTWIPSKGWPPTTDSVLVPISDKLADGVFYVFDRGSSTVLASIDGGATFNTIITGIPKVEGWQSAQLAVTPGILRDLWLATPVGLFHSPGSGQALSAVKGVDEAWRLGFGKAAPGQAYPAVFLWGKVKGQEGLWRSDDVGKAWTRINDDAHQFGAIDAVAGDPFEFGTVYIAPAGRGVLAGRLP